MVGARAGAGVRIIILIVLTGATVAENAILHDYGDALSKSVLFFEGQRSGKLPSNQRLTWRRDSALRDGSDKGVDLTGGYYDAGDNVKFNFPMAFTTTMLAWSVIEYGRSMGPDLGHAMEAVRWSTDYFLKCTSVPGVVFAGVGDPNADHNCWQRPEDMQTPRTVYAVSEKAPGSEVSAEIAAALAAASMVFKASGHGRYSNLLLQRATKVFEFADKFRGSYNTSIGSGVCPFYCDYNGYQDELVWAAAWLHKATGNSQYWNYVSQNIQYLTNAMLEFGWDAKHAGINVLVSKYVLNNPSLVNMTPFLSYADNFVCDVLPESPIKSFKYSPGGLMYKPGDCNMQHTTTLSFLTLTYARYIKSSKRIIQCKNVRINSERLIQFSKSQVDYILGSNPLKMSLMVGYGKKFPQHIHHRGSSLPSIAKHPKLIACKEGTPYYQTKEPNPNLLIGAVVGGPDLSDSFSDDRKDPGETEPTTYVNAPLVGLLAYFKGNK
ncbi:endoglucanase 8-like [Primulina eburnea]|uniref:endoglucanase 8-like n=1 Tax=Primulina eburnea TaxID=1245227 RepID=UPI003C6C7395